MFLKDNMFKRLIKSAWKNNNLYLAATAEEICISSGWWVCWINKDHVPNTILGTLYELAGEMPDAGEKFRSGKEGNQYELEVPRLEQYIALKNAQGKPITVTNILLDSVNCNRVLQEPESWDVTLVDERIIAMICLKEIEKEAGETAPQGPYRTRQGVYWENNIMTFFSTPGIDDKNKDFVGALEKMDLEELAEK